MTISRSPIGRHPISREAQASAAANVEIYYPYTPDEIETCEAPDHLDTSVFDFYAAAPLPADVVVAADLPVFQFPDIEELDEAEFYPDYFAQGPPLIPDNDVAVSRFEDASTQLEDIDEDFGFGSDQLSADFVVVTDQGGQEDSDGQLEDADEDFGFSFGPLQPDDQGAQELPVPEEPEDEAFGFDTSIQDDVVVAADQIWTEDASSQLEDTDEDFGITLDPLPDDNDVAVTRADDADTQLEDTDEDYGVTAGPLQDDDQGAQEFAPPEELEDESFGFDVSIQDDAVVTQDQIWAEDASLQFEEPDEDFGNYNVPLSDDFFSDMGGQDDAADQLEDVDEDYGWYDVPLADDNEVAVARVEDASGVFEEPDEDFGAYAAPLADDFTSDAGGQDDAADQLEDFDEDYGVYVAPLADDNDLAAALSDDAADQLEDIDEDYGVYAGPLQDDDQGAQEFTPAEEPEDEPFGFDIPPIPDALVVQSNQVFVEDASNLAEIIEDAGDDQLQDFNDRPLPDDFVIPNVCLFDPAIFDPEIFQGCPVTDTTRRPKRAGRLRLAGGAVAHVRGVAASWRGSIVHAYGKTGSPVVFVGPVYVATQLPPMAVAIPTLTATERIPRQILPQAATASPGSVRAAYTLGKVEVHYGTRGDAGALAHVPVALGGVSAKGGAVARPDGVEATYEVEEEFGVWGIQNPSPEELVNVIMSVLKGKP